MVRGGSGGDGCSAFRREKFIPHGGPSGGNGGHGGSVILETSPQLYTLVDFAYQRQYEAKPGGNGQGSDKHGGNGPDLVVPVPVGTMVYRKGEFLADLTEARQRLEVAQGGRGGRGNASFASATRRAPRLREHGDKGDEAEITLELRLIADVGIIGKPNAGKSTLLAAVTAAEPKVADYPFTTLSPVLGVATFPDLSTATLAEIPGLVDGAHEGAGLGLEFLRHAMRTRLLVYLLDADAEPLGDLELLRQEVSSYNADLAARPALVVLNKIDLVDEDRLKELEGTFQDRKLEPLLVSAKEKVGLEALLNHLQAALLSAPPIIPQAPRFRLYRLAEEDPRAFIARKVQEGLFEVHGEHIEKLVARADLDNEDGLKRLQKQIDRLGVEKELRRLDIQEGDTVRIGRIEFDYHQEGDGH